MVFILNFIILFYFIYLFIIIIIIILVDKIFTPSEILDLELRFCTGQHLIREIVLKFLNLLFVLGSFRFILYHHQCDVPFRMH